MRSLVLAVMTAAALNASAATPANTDTGLTNKDGQVRAQISARNEVVLSSELSAKIASLPLREGESFKAGQTLVSFDCSLYQAQLNKGQATLDAARQVLSVNTRLAELNSIGKLELATGEAKVKEGEAEVSFLQTTLRKCTVSAPWAGRVVKRLAAAHQFVTPGTQLLAIQDAGELEVHMIVPSKWLARIKVGGSFSVQVEELGKSFNARVQRLGARIDPLSQSIEVVGVVNGAGGNLLPGMSGWAVFP
ncbi:efflux RND transporter periplasmic adaptor subunit [Roseateles sp. P5_E7]